MPPTTQELLDAVRARAVNTSFAYFLLEQLFFGRSDADVPKMKERLAIMQSEAGGFSSIVRDVLLDSVLLGIAVLMDPATTPVKRTMRDNLSIERLLLEVDAVSSSDTSRSPEAHSIHGDHQVLVNAVEKIGKLRNRRIAHADAASVLDPAEKLKGVTLAELRDAVTKTFNLMNSIEVFLAKSETVYDQPIVQGCGEAVVIALDRAARFDELEKWLL